MKPKELSLLLTALSGSNVASIQQALSQLDQYLTLRTCINGHTLGEADFEIWNGIRGNELANVFLRKTRLVNLGRWHSYVQAKGEDVQQDQNAGDQMVNARKQARKGASYRISLQDAEIGKVVTRFCPAPSYASPPQAYPS